MPSHCRNNCRTKTLEQGDVHIKTIHETGQDGMILGHRSLEEDGIEPDFFKSQEGFANNCMLMKGYQQLSFVTKEEWQKYPTFSTWGYLVIKNLAEKYFL